MLGICPNQIEAWQSIWKNDLVVWKEWNNYV
jgi:hypothetical protein